MGTKISGGSASNPGVTSDGRTPGGIIIAGRLRAGYPESSALLYHIINGNLSLNSTQAMMDDEDDVLDVSVNGTLTADNHAYTAFITRSANQNGFDFRNPMLFCDDGSSSDTPVAEFRKQNTAQFTVDPDGIRVHNKFKTGAAIAHVLGAYSGNAVPIYDESGTLLGYMPLYA